MEDSDRQSAWNAYALILQSTCAHPSGGGGGVSGYANETEVQTAGIQLRSR